jgi:hypothetical protein
MEDGLPVTLYHQDNIDNPAGCNDIEQNRFWYPLSYEYGAVESPISKDASSEHSEARLSEPASARKWNVLPRSLSKPALPQNRMFWPPLLYTEIHSHINQILLCCLPSKNARRGSSRILLGLYLPSHILENHPKYMAHNPISIWLITCSFFSSCSTTTKKGAKKTSSGHRLSSLIDLQRYKHGQKTTSFGWGRYPKRWHFATSTNDNRGRGTLRHRHHRAKLRKTEQNRLWTRELHTKIKLGSTKNWKGAAH